MTNCQGMCSDSRERTSAVQGKSTTSFVRLPKERREIPEIVAELKNLEQKATKITKELDGIVQQLKVSAASES